MKRIFREQSSHFPGGIQDLGSSPLRDPPGTNAQSNFLFVLYCTGKHTAVSLWLSRDQDPGVRHGAELLTWKEKKQAEICALPALALDQPSNTSMCLCCCSALPSPSNQGSHLLLREGSGWWPSTPRTPPGFLLEWCDQGVHHYAALPWLDHSQNPLACLGTQEWRVSPATHSPNSPATLQADFSLLKYIHYISSFSWHSLRLISCRLG